MAEIRAEYRPPRPHQGGRRRKDGAVIRIGAAASAAAGVNPGPAPIFLTPAEAERIAGELLRAAKLARAAVPEPTPEPTPQEDSPDVSRD